MGSFLDDVIEGKIDFGGQQTVDNLSRITLVISSFLSFCIGFALQDLRITFGLMGVSVLALAVVILPPWPTFNRHPVQWLSPKETKR